MARWASEVPSTARDHRVAAVIRGPGSQSTRTPLTCACATWPCRCVRSTCCVGLHARSTRVGRRRPQPLADKTRAAVSTCPPNPPQLRTPVAGREPRSQSRISLPRLRAPILVRPGTLAGLSTPRRVSRVGCTHCSQRRGCSQPRLTVKRTGPCYDAPTHTDRSGRRSDRCGPLAARSAVRSTSILVRPLNEAIPKSKL